MANTASSSKRTKFNDEPASGVFNVARERPYALTLGDEGAVRRLHGEAIEYALDAVEPLLDCWRDYAHGTELAVKRMKRATRQALVALEDDRRVVAEATRMAGDVERHVADFAARRFGAGGKAIAGAEALLAYLLEEFAKRGITPDYDAG